MHRVLFEILGKLIYVTYFANSSIESDVDDEQKDLPMTTTTTTNPPQVPEVASTSSITYGPHRKLSRGEEINKFHTNLRWSRKANLSAPLCCCYPRYSKLAVKHLVV